MSEASRDMDTSAEGNKVGPKYFDYYTREVACLLSQTEDFLPFVSQTSDLAGRTCRVNRETDITKDSYTGKEGNSFEAGSLFCDAVGAGISDFKKERLKVLLRQSVVLLSREVDEMVDPVFAMRRIQNYKMKISSCPNATCEDNGERPHKKHKVSSLSSSIRSSPISCMHNGEGSGNENMYLAKPGEEKSNVVNKMCSNCLTTETSRWSSDSEVLKSLCHDCEIKSKEGKESLSIKDQKTKSVCKIKSKKGKKSLAVKDQNTKLVRKIKSKEGKKFLTVKDLKTESVCEIKSRKGNESLAIKDQKTKLVLASNIKVEKEDGGVNDDLQLLLETDSEMVEETMKKISDELSETLGCMKQKLEELLDTVMSNYRLMTLAEKQRLQILIQKLPLRNLDRVVEIIQRSNPSAKYSSDNVFVDLERVDNTTLWRLYYSVQAVENVRKLSAVD